MAIYNGIFSELLRVKLFLCTYHLEENDRQNIQNLVHQKGFV